MNKSIDYTDIEAERESFAISRSNKQRNAFYNKKSSGSPSIAPCDLFHIESRKHCRHRSSRQVNLVRQKWIELGNTLKQRKYNISNIQL